MLLALCSLAWLTAKAAHSRSSRTSGTSSERAFGELGNSSSA